MTDVGLLAGVVVWLMCGVAAVLVGQTKGRPAGDSFMFGAVFGIFGLAWVALSDPHTTRKCPECAEKVLIDAKVCKHCGHRFVEEPLPPPGKVSIECPLCDTKLKIPEDAKRFRCARCGEVSPVPD